MIPAIDPVSVNVAPVGGWVRTRPLVLTTMDRAFQSGGHLKKVMDCPTMIQPASGMEGVA